MNCRCQKQQYFAKLADRNKDPWVVRNFSLGGKNSQMCVENQLMWDPHKNFLHEFVLQCLAKTEFRKQQEGISVKGCTY